MPNKYLTAHTLLWRPRRAKVTTSPLPVDLPSPTLVTATLSCSVPSDHGSLCLALANTLIRRSLLLSARVVVSRIIAKHSSSVHDAILAIDCAHAHGMDLDPVGYGSLMRKLVGCGEHRLAESFFRHRVACHGMNVDLSTLNYMITCYCSLAKIEGAVDSYNGIVDLDSFPTKAASYAVVRELCARESVSQAFSIFLAMCDARMDMGIWIYNMLADKLCEKGYLDETYKVLTLMRERSRRMPTLHQYKTLFCGLCRTGQTVKAELLSGEMESLGFFIDKIMYTQLIHGCGMER